MSFGIISTGTILDRIVARKQEEVALLPRNTVPERSSIRRNFAGALRREDGSVALIAEIKHASPSKGVLIDPFDPVSLADQYLAGGAAAISVLTDRDFFQGSLADMRVVRHRTGLPVLRKDFIIDSRQIIEAYNAGADAMLLIAAILDDSRLRDLHMIATGIGLAVLVEVHTEAEMRRVINLNCPLIGINNRDLHTFEVDLGVFEQVSRWVPPDASITLVAESGIFSPEDVARVAAAGAHAVLVGESLVKAGNIAGQVKLLAGVPRCASH